MNTKLFCLLAVFIPLSIFAQPCTVSDASGCVCEDGSTDCYLLPNIKLSYDLLVDPAQNPETPGELRISVSTPNVGHGPLRVIATNDFVCGVDTFFNSNITVCPDGTTPSQLVKQRIYRKQGNTMTSEDRWAGTMTYHPTHNHSHFDDWGVYSLRIPDPNEPDPLQWPMIGEGSKLGFCLMDFGSCEFYNGHCRDDNDNILTTDSPNYGLGGGQYSCGVTNQGITAGWTDIYYHYLDGMFITIPQGVCNGDYMIVVQVDPNNVLLEENENDNLIVAPITLTQQNPPDSIDVNPTILVNGSTTLCQGESVELSVSESGTAYLWSNGATTSSITVTTAGTYTCTVTTPCGTASTPPVTIGTITCACQSNYNFISMPACSGDSVAFALDTGCVSVINNTFGFEMDLDFYIYAPGGIPNQAVAGYDPLAATGGIDPSYPISNQDLLVVGGVGQFWNVPICSDVSTLPLTNNTCSPLTVTYFAIPWDYGLDSGNDGGFGEYNNVSPLACQLLRYDVPIYPAPLNMVIIDDGSNCGGILAELISADSTVCEIVEANCTLNGESFVTNFATTATGAALANAPAGCALPSEETFVCSGCPCQSTYNFTSSPVCSNDSITFLITPDCESIINNALGQEMDLDFYMYAPGGVPAQAAAVYDPLNATGGIDNTYPISNQDLAVVGGTGPFWGRPVCSDVMANAVINNTCSPITITYFVLPWDYGLDSDGDGGFGEYNNGTPYCPMLRYDVQIYPASFTFNVC